MHVLVHLQSYTAKKGCLLTFPPLGDSPGVSDAHKYAES